MQRKLRLLLVLALPLLNLYPQATPGNPELSEREIRFVKEIHVKSIPVTPKEMSIQTQWFFVEFDALGAKIKNFRHRDHNYPLRDNVVLTEPEIWPMQIYFWPKPSREALQNSYYSLSKMESPDEITLTASLPVELETENPREKIPALFKKVFIFRKNEHFWQFRFVVEAKTQKPLRITPVVFYPLTTVGPAADEKSPRSAHSRYAFVHQDGDFHIIYLGESSSFLGCSNSSGQNQKFLGKIDFFGLSSRFMVVALQPLVPTSALHYFKENLPFAQLHLELPHMDIYPNKASEISFFVYSGPKVGDYLSPTSPLNQNLPYRSEVHKDLYKSFDFGITAPIRDLIVLILGFFYKIIPNYGVGIIIFALLFKLIFYPLNQKQAESMKKMSDLSPKIQEINERYKDNPQEKNRRLMLLYQEHKINPMGGCLPILIQIPIFIALYSAFSDAYELWRSPFIKGWVDDLSEPDTVFILPLMGGFSIHLLPILMTITQFLQTKLTVFTGDENQRRLMLFMPFLMLVFFWSMPSGVVLYWTIQNILSIIQQLITNLRQKTQTKGDTV